MAGYIGANTSSVTNNQNAAERRKKFTFTANTTALTGLSFLPNKIHIFHNGIRLVRNTDYTEASDGQSVTLTNAAQAGDEIVAVTFDQNPAIGGGSSYTDADVDAHLLTAGVTLDATNDKLQISTSRTASTNAVALLLDDNVTGIQTNGVYKAIRSTSNNSAAVSEVRFLETDGTNNNTGISFATQSAAASLTENMRIDNFGRVTIPNQVYFHVKLNSNVGHSGSSPAVKLNTWVALGTYGGLGSDFSSANQSFTAPVDGRYLFNYSGLHHSGGVSAGYSRAYTYVNGSMVIDGLGDNDTEGDYQRIAYSAILDLSANDYVDIRVNGNNSNGFVYSHYSYWSGYLLG